jgi:peptide/nickel transport system permease protein
MTRYILKRVLLLAPVLLAMCVFLFLVLHLFSAGPAALMPGQHLSANQIEAPGQELNDPVYLQFGRFMQRLTHGDLGYSMMTKTPVTTAVLSSFPATIELVFASMLIAVAVGVIVGLITAVKQYSIFNSLSKAGVLAGTSVPVYWLGLMLIMIFSVKLGWLPVSGRIDIGLEPAGVTGLYLADSLVTGNWAAFISALKHIILPAAALAAFPMAEIARMTRATMLEVLRQDYVRTARAKGLNESVVIYRHALRNALLPVVKLTGFQVGPLLGGAVLTETVFFWPGTGGLLVNAVMAADYPLAQGCVLLMAAFYMVVNLLVNLLHGFLDPGIRYS